MVVATNQIVTIGAINLTGKIGNVVCCYRFESYTVFILVLGSINNMGDPNPEESQGRLV